MIIMCCVRLRTDVLNTVISGPGLNWFIWKILPTIIQQDVPFVTRCSSGEVLNIEYSSLLEAKELKQSGKAEKGFQGAANYHSARCSFSHNKGHTEDTWWKKHPHLKPPSTKTRGSKVEEKTTPTKSEPTFKHEAKGLTSSKNKVKNYAWTISGSRE